MVARCAPFTYHERVSHVDSYGTETVTTKTRRKRRNPMTTPHDLFLESLARGPVLCDGAMGTLLYARLGTAGTQNAALCFDALNLTHPDIVQEVHQEYLTAGARVIETNTFGANRVKLSRYGRGAEVRAINRQECGWHARRA